MNCRQGSDSEVRLKRQEAKFHGGQRKEKITFFFTCGYFRAPAVAILLPVSLSYLVEVAASRTPYIAFSSRLHCWC